MKSSNSAKSSADIVIDGFEDEDGNEVGDSDVLNYPGNDLGDGFGADEELDLDAKIGGGE